MKSNNTTFYDVSYKRGININRLNKNIWKLISNEYIDYSYILLKNIKMFE
jgi:hypothetical protein